MAAKLEAYKAKRRFTETPEPQGGEAGPEEPIFVVQRHDARRLHYDLRLQIGDTLKSWAVPEGPCLDPAVRRFAKLVEDHPLAYAAFEGQIPAGNYGAGEVIIWDRGTWVTLADPEEAVARGELKFRLAGEKLAGGWMLKRLPDDRTNWLLIKERDPAARPLADYDILREQPESVVTGRKVKEALAVRKPPARRRAARIPGAVPAPMPAQWKPQLVTPAPAPPSGAGWIHEIKYDGYRTLVFMRDGKARLITRNGRDWTARYGTLARAFEDLRCRSAILDGEIVVQDSRGATSLALLEEALSTGATHRLVFYVFDLCYLDGYDLSAVALRQRKAALEGLIASVVGVRSPLQYSDHVEGDGGVVFAEASRMGLEGIVSKRAEARYVQARSPDWLKTKRVDIASFVIIGFVCNMPSCVSSLMLAEERNGALAFVGRVGSGIGEETGRELFRVLSEVERETAPLKAPRTPAARWVEPAWTAKVGYRDRSANDAPRAPVLLGFSRLPPPRGGTPLKPRLVRDRDLAAVQLTNPEREIFTGSGASKLDLALYYARVGDWMLPELLRRPLTLLRCPTGALADCFYQRHAFAGLPAGLEVIDLADEQERAAFLAVTEARGYLALMQFGAIELHPWGCRIDDPEHPDRLILDLDPDVELPWARVCDGAERIRERLESLGLRPFLRTTGGKGLHLVVALAEGAHDWSELKGFAAALARSLAADAPRLFTAVSSKERRKGRIYIDYLRNARGATAVASYSLRARPGFPVAAPIAWDELSGLSGGDAFDRLSMPLRLETLANDPWDELRSTAAKISPKMRREVGLIT